jgi:hypothetical protein
MVRGRVLRFERSENAWDARAKIKFVSLKCLGARRCEFCERDAETRRRGDDQPRLERGGDACSRRPVGDASSPRAQRDPLVGRAFSMKAPTIPNPNDSTSRQPQRNRRRFHRKRPTERNESTIPPIPQPRDRHASLGGAAAALCLKLTNLKLPTLRRREARA